MPALSVCLLFTLCCVCAAPAEHNSAQDTNKIEVLSLLYKQVVALYQAGSYQQAIPIAQQLLKACEESFGPENRNTTADLSYLALLYKATGDCAKAEPLYQRALRIWEKALDPEHFFLSSGLHRDPPSFPAQGPYA